MGEDSECRIGCSAESDHCIAIDGDEQLTRLKIFRQAAYECLGYARHTRFEFMDAALVTPVANPDVESTQTQPPDFGCCWGGAYQALEDGRSEPCGTPVCFSHSPVIQ